MKNINYLLLFGLSMAFLNASSQNTQWVMSSPQDSQIVVSDMAGNSNKSVFLFKQTNGTFTWSTLNFWVERYDMPSMKKIYEKKIEGTEEEGGKGKSLIIDNAYSLKQGVIVIAISNDSRTAYAMLLNSDDGSLKDGKKLTLAEINPQIEGEISLKFEVSKDGSSLIMYYVSSSSPVIHTMCIDANLTIKWKKDIMPSFSNSDFTIVQVFSKDGNEIAMLASVNDSINKHNIDYVFLYYNFTGNISFETPLYLDTGEKITSFRMGIDNAANPVICGKYLVDGNKNQLTGGVYGIRIDAKSGKILAQATTEFTDEFEAKMMSESTSRRDLNPYLRINYIGITPANDIIISLERIEKMSCGGSTGFNGGHNINSGPTINISHEYNYYVYYYKDLVFAKLNSQTLKPEWMTIIPKKGFSGGVVNKSYGVTIQGDSATVMFCDNIKNASLSPKKLNEDANNLKEYKFDKEGKNLSITICKVDLKSGNQKRNYFTNPKAERTTLNFNPLHLVNFPDVYVFNVADAQTTGTDE